MHLAETREQAIEDVRFGLDDWCDYTQKILAVPHFRAAGETFEERVAWVNETGLGVIGTPDDAIAQIERLEKQSNGGFGAYLHGPSRMGAASSRQPSLRAVRPTTSSHGSSGSPHGPSPPNNGRSPNGRNWATVWSVPSPRQPNAITPNVDSDPAASPTTSRCPSLRADGCQVPVPVFRFGSGSCVPVPEGFQAALIREGRPPALANAPFSRERS